MNILFSILLIGLILQLSTSFIQGQLHRHIAINRPIRDISTILYAKKTAAKKKKKKGKNSSTSGFGGAAAEDCPCGSGLGYMKCCGKVHKDSKAYADATAEQVVRARYSAYAKREVDFIVGSTHQLNKNFMSDIQHWKDQIKMNCYDNFELKKCEIVDESYENEGEGEKQVAKVKFIATTIQVDSREKTAFMETSLFERGGKNIMDGAWLCKLYAYLLIVCIYSFNLCLSFTHAIFTVYAYDLQTFR